MALRFNMKSIMLLFLLATGPFWLEYLLHQKIWLFWGSESFKMFHGLRLQPILAVNVCRCAIWRWFPFTSPCLSMGECEAMPAASSVTPFFLVTCAYRQRSLLENGSWLTSQIQIDSSNDPLPYFGMFGLSNFDSGLFNDIHAPNSRPISASDSAHFGDWNWNVSRFEISLDTLW